MSTSNDAQYSGWCTNWGAYDVPTLWKMLQNEDPTKTSQHVSAWRMTYELLSVHMAELKLCRDDLAAKWPAESSPAAATFLNYVDNTLASMKATGDAAVANYDAVAGINGALITAKAEIGKLHEQWKKNQHEEDTSMSIFGWQPFSDAPDHWKEQLKAQAAKEMVKADTTVFESTAKMTPPPVYEPRTSTTDGSKDFPADGSASGTGGGTAGHSGGGWAQPPFIPAPVPVQPPAPPSPPPAPGQGALLTGGVAAPAPTAPGMAPTPVTSTPPLSSPGLPPGGVIGARPGMLRGEPSAGVGRGSAGTSARAGITGRGAAGVGGESAGVHARTALPPGGVIGGAPGAQGASRTTASGMRRVNPVGGVIGEHASGPTAAASGGQPIGSAGQRGAGRRRDESDQHFDPDNPWATEEGVPGVLRPQAEVTRHEAGPGVIGIDR